MDQEDPEKRIAELERQLAEQKRISELERQLADAKAAAAREDRAVDQPSQFSDAQAADEQGAIDEHARRYAQTLWEGLRAGEPSGPEGSSGPEVAQLREALMRAAADAGMSQAKVNDALQHAHVTIKTGHSVVYPGQGGPYDFAPPAGIGPQPAFAGGAGFRRQAGFGRQWPRRKRVGAYLVGVVVVAAIMLLLALFVEGAAPSSTLWTSKIVCSSPYHLAYNPGHDYISGRVSGRTGVSFQCVSGDSSYHVAEFAIIALQALLFALVLGGAVAVGGLMWRLLRKPR